MKRKEDETIMIVDTDNGDIQKAQKVEVSKNYCMLFWDIGEEAVGKEPSAVALRVFLSILHRVEYNTGKVFMGPSLRKEIMEKQGLNKAQMSIALGVLKEKSILLLTTDDILVINPLLAWKGSMTERDKLINSPKVLIPITSKEW